MGRVLDVRLYMRSVILRYQANGYDLGVGVWRFRWMGAELRAIRDTLMILGALVAPLARYKRRAFLYA